MVCTKELIDIAQLEDNLCKKLNAEQTLAVKTDLDEYTSVIAGAGTGKTTIISSKYVDFIAKLCNKGIKTPLEHILVITFTEKAAANMKNKIFNNLKANKIDYLGQESHISTIHAFCSKILRAHAIEAGLTQYFNVGNDEDLSKIYDTIIQKIKEGEFEKIAFIQDAAKKLNIDLSILEHKNLLKLQDISEKIDQVLDSVLSVINQVKSLGLNAVEFLEHTKLATSNFSKSTQNIPTGELSYEDFAKKWSDYLYDNGYAEDKDIFDGNIFEKNFAGSKYFFNKEKDGKTLNKKRCGEWKKGDYFEDLPKIEELENYITEIIALIYETYQMQLLKADLIGFDDMINLTLHILDNENIRQEYQDKFEHIIVDEFQDTSVAQLKLITKLIKQDYPNVTVVGDRKQSIYAFRYANMENISDLTEFIKNKYGTHKVKEINLKTNYRSTKSVIEIVNDITTNFIKKADEVLDTPHLPIENSIKMCSFGEKKADETKSDEAKQIAIEINNFINNPQNEKLSFKDFAVLVRSAKEGDIIEQQLTSCGIPSVKKGGESFFNKITTKNSKALLALAYNLTDEYSLIGLLTRIFSDKELYLLKKGLDKEVQGIETFDAENANFAEKVYICYAKGLLKNIKSTNQNLVSTLENLIATAENAGQNVKNLSLSNIYQKLTEAFSPDNGCKGVEKLLAERDIEIFKRIIAEYEQTEIYPSIKNFLNYLDKIKDDKQFILPDVTKGELNAVQIMTIHASKGLEFPYVFIFGISQNGKQDSDCLKFELGSEKKGNFGLIIAKYKNNPSLKSTLYKKAYKSPKENKEAVRLFYVAASRAEKYLNIFCLNEKSKSKPADYVLNLNIPQKERFEVKDEDLKNLPKLKLKTLPIQKIANKIELTERKETLPKLNLSFSKINTYKHCPKKFLLQYVYAYPQLISNQKSKGAEIGTTVHSLIYSSFVNKRAYTEDELKEIFKGKIEENEAKRITNMYNAFLKSPYADFSSENSIAEQSFSFEFENVVFKGDIDLTITNSDKTKTIIDFKTNKEIEKSLNDYAKQLYIYKEALEKNNQHVKETIILNLQSDECIKHDMTPRLNSAGKEIKKDINEIEETCKNNDAKANISNNCYICGYKYLCQSEDTTC